MSADLDILDEPWLAWHEQRVPTALIHFDSAAAGRSSAATQHAVAQHVRRESEIGAYIAQAEAAAALDEARSDIAHVIGVEPDGLAFVESATNALAALLAAWPLPRDGVVAVAPSEWGPNVAAFRAHGLRPIELTVDGAGRVDLNALAHLLASDPPALVHITQVASHRALVQPVDAVSAVCRSAGVPLWVDAAQAFGHVDMAVCAAAVYATSRKWMCGPRGVGFLGIAREAWPALTVRHSVLASSDEPTVRALESDDAHIAGRVGLAAAVRQFLAAGPTNVTARLAEVGRMTREALVEVPGWDVVDASDAGTATTALRPTSGQDLITVRARLIAEHSILTTVSTTARAPGELTAPLLRLSPHVDCTPAQLQALRGALAALAS